MLSRAMHFNEYLGVQALFFLIERKKKKITQLAQTSQGQETPKLAERLRLVPTTLECDGIQVSLMMALLCIVTFWQI